MFTNLEKYNKINNRGNNKKRNIKSIEKINNQYKIKNHENKNKY